MPVEEPPERAHPHRHTGLGQLGPDLRERDVRLAVHELEDQRRVCLDARGAPVPAQRIALAALTPKRAAAARQDAPTATAPTTRSRRSTDNAFDMPASLPAAGQ